MSYCEDDLLPISALQHLWFCPRQWGLIHLEGVWEENRWTAEGRVLHVKVHAGIGESRGSVRVARSLRLRSLQLGLTGQADVVEFHRLTDPDGPGVRLEGVAGRWRPMPVEYKRGRPKENRCDEVQLCAQAMCLEEMLSVTITEAAFYYHQLRRRQTVTLDASLRSETEALAARLHELTAAAVTPVAEPDKRCQRCSLKERCLPAVTAGKSATSYLHRALADAAADGQGEPP